MKLEEVGLDPRVLETVWRWQDVVNGSRAFAQSQMATTLEEEAETFVLDTDEDSPGEGANVESLKDVGQEVDSGSEGATGEEQDVVVSEETSHHSGEEDREVEVDEKQAGRRRAATRSPARSRQSFEKSSRSPSIGASAREGSEEEADSDEYA